MSDRHHLFVEMFDIFDKYSIDQNIGIAESDALTTAREYATAIADVCVRCGYEEPDKRETANFQYNSYLTHCVGKVKVVRTPEPSQNVTVKEVETNDEFDDDSIPF